MDHDDYIDEDEETTGFDEVESASASDATSPPTEAHRYQLGRRLGSGGMAVVYRALDTQLNRPVAVKVLRKELVRNAEARIRFLDEARVIAELDHPGVVPVFEIGRLPEGEDFYAMKEVSGMTFKEILELRPPHDLGDRHGLLHYVDLFTRVCETMAAAHAKGIVHRDLKPANIMVDQHGTVCVMDWGLAKRLSDDQSDESGQTVVGAVMGTPSYMSPEQASGHTDKISCQSDVFSLGILLYEILARQRPFSGDDPRATMDGVIHHAPKPPREENPRVPRALSLICMKALAKDIGDRYASATELVEDIHRFRAFRPVSVAPQNLREKLASWGRRHPTASAVLATVLLVLLVAGFGTALQASVEHQMVMRAFERIDATELEIELVEVAIMKATTDLKTADSQSSRQRLEQQLVDLHGRREGLNELVVGLATAVTGFTIFEPEERAQRILRESLLEKVDFYVESGQFSKAEVAIASALSIVSKRNPFNLAENEIRRLERHRTTVRQRLSQLESDQDGSD